MARIGELIEIIEVELPEGEQAAPYRDAPHERAAEEGREVEVERTGPDDRLREKRRQPA